MTNILRSNISTENVPAQNHFGRWPPESTEVGGKCQNEIDNKIPSDAYS